MERGVPECKKSKKRNTEGKREGEKKEGKREGKKKEGKREGEKKDRIEREKQKEDKRQAPQRGETRDRLPYRIKSESGNATQVHRRATLPLNINS